MEYAANHLLDASIFDNGAGMGPHLGILRRVAKSVGECWGIGAQASKPGFQACAVLVLVCQIFCASAIR